MRIATHNGVFHSDDVFAVAALLLRFGEGHEIVRTRDEEEIALCDVVVDVGMVYDEDGMRFDHHQGPPVRDNGVPYASFGLVWRKFGAELAGSKRAAARIDMSLAQPIDAADNSVEVVVPNADGLAPYTINDVFDALRPTWREGAEFDAPFLEAVALAKRILEREIEHAKAADEAYAVVKGEYDNAADRRMLVLDRKYPYDEFMREFPETLLVLFPGVGGSWHVKVARDDPRVFKSRIDFPQAWAGKKDRELASVTGVPDAIFCHRGRFLAVAGSREGAVRLAELALAES